MPRFLLGKYSTKADVYHIAICLRNQLGLNTYPLDSKEIAQAFCNNPLIEYVDFDTTDICGILYRGDTSTEIALNKGRTTYQQNFDCAHELIHYFCHSISYCECICSEKIIKQEKSFEYQANEGAAQLLVPYELFIPEVADLFCTELSSFDINVRIAELARKYGVTDAVITVRLQSLKYEISQYVSGVPIERIRILSDSRQKQERIMVESIIDIRDRKFTEEDMEGFRLCMQEENIFAI